MTDDDTKQPDIKVTDYTGIASAERTVALRKLLESKDAAVRAQLLGDIKSKEAEHG